MFRSLAPSSRGTLLLVTAIFAFSIMDALANFLTQSLHPLQVVWARYTFHVLLSLAIIGRNAPALLRTPNALIQGVRSVLLFGATISFFTAFRFLNLPEATAIFQIAPIFITLGAFLFLGEAIGPYRWIGVFVGFLGALIIIRPGFDVFTWAALFPILAAVFYASYTLSTRALSANEDPWTSFLYTALFGTLVSCCCVPFFWTNPTPMEWIASVAIGGVGALGHYLLIRALSLAEASALAPWTYVSIVFSLIWGALIFAEFPDAATLAGAGLIVAAGLTIWWRERRRAQS